MNPTKKLLVALVATILLGIYAWAAVSVNPNYFGFTEPEPPVASKLQRVIDDLYTEVVEIPTATSAPTEDAVVEDHTEVIMITSVWKPAVTSPSPAPEYTSEEIPMEAEPIEEETLLETTPEKDFSEEETPPVETLPVEILPEEETSPKESTPEIIIASSIEEDVITIDEDDVSLTYVGQRHITGYDACVQCCGKLPGSTGYGITASGTVVAAGRTCAANGFPFGTVLYIDGIGYRTVEDRGGMRDGGIDVYCVDHPACYAITGYYDVYVVSTP